MSYRQSLRRTVVSVLLVLLVAASPGAGAQTYKGASPPSAATVGADRFPDTVVIPPPAGTGTRDGVGGATGGRGGDGERGQPPAGGQRGGGSGRNNALPVAIIGAAALVAIGSLLAAERAQGTTPPSGATPDPIVDQLLSNGPQMAAAFNMSAFAVRGFVRGGWPVLVDFQQRTPGTTKLRISARELPEIYTYELSQVCPPPRRCLIQFRLPPEVFGDQLRPAVIAATATDAQGNATQPEFDVFALGAGPRAIGSVAIDQVSFGPSVIRVADGQQALYRFFSHSDFGNAAVEFWKVEKEFDGSRLFFVDDRSIEGGIRKNQWIGLNERREWDGTEKGQKVSTGQHKVQVRAWDRAGDWVTAWSSSMVSVEQ